MDNYNNTEYQHKGSVICFEQVVRTELGFYLVYKLVKRRRTEHDWCHVDVYDIVISKRYGISADHDSAAEVTLTAISSDLDRALCFFEKLVKNTVTPMCAYEIVEEMLS